MIERYNFGFGFFGPLEQAEEGKFCKAEDVLEILDSHQRLRRNFHNVSGKRDALQNECNVLSDENYLKSTEIERLEKRNEFLDSQVEDLQSEIYFKSISLIKAKQKYLNRVYFDLLIVCFLVLFGIGKIVLDNFEFISGLF
jgi:hypothetical protein